MPDPIRILCVDDEPSLLDISKIYLESREGFAVDTQTDARGALDLLREKRYDAIVSDYQMPGMDGIEFLKQVRASGNTVPFIIFTGRGREEVVIQALNEGADFYIQKGGDPRSQFADLANKVRYAVRRQRVEEALHDLERREADILNFLPDATFAIDTNGVVIAWNRAMEKMTGVPAREILGSGNFEYAIPFYRERRPILIDLVLKEDPETAAKYPFIRREGDKLISEIRIPHFNNGEGAFLWFTASPLYDRSGEIAGAIETIRDITDRKHVEDELRATHEQLKAAEEELQSQYRDLATRERQISESEEKYRALVEGLPDIVMRFDREGRHLFVSKNVRTVVDIEPERFIGKTHAELGFPADLCRFWEESIRRVFDSGEPFETEFTFEGKCGPVIFNWRLLPERYAQGAVSSVLSVSRDITAHRRAEKDYRTLFREMLDGFALHEIILDAAGNPVDYRFLDVNPAFERMTGLKREEILGRTVLEVLPGTERHWIETYGRVALTGEPAHFENYSAGIGKYFEVTAYCPLPGHFSCIFHDVTERRRAEEALQRSEERFRELTDLLPQVIFECDAEGNLLYANRIAFGKFGYSTDELAQGLNVLQMLAPEERDRAAGVISGILEGRAPPAHGTEYRALRKDGSTFPVSIYSSPLVASGRIAGLRGIIVDMTERKQVEEALRESEALYRSLAETTPGMVYLVSADGVVRFVNRHAAEAFGIRETALVGRRLDEIFPPDIADQHLASIRRVVERKTPIHHQIREEFPALGVRWIDVYLTPVRGEGGEVTAVLGNSFDITDRKRAEEALREANRKLGLLTSVTRHDISNQLLVIRGFLALLGEQLSNPAIAESYQRILSAADRISAMIRFTKEYENIGVDAPAWLDLRDLIREAVGEATIGKVQVTNDIPTGTEVFADPLIGKVFSNLLDNAIRHGEKVTAIRFSAYEDGDRLLVTCGDDGVGIPAGEKEKIFERGYGKNTGLGLFLAREILSITGITIRETGEEGMGAKFEIAVPAGTWRKRPKTAGA